MIRLSADALCDGLKKFMIVLNHLLFIELDCHIFVSLVCYFKRIHLNRSLVMNGKYNVLAICGHECHVWPSMQCVGIDVVNG